MEPSRPEYKIPGGFFAKGLVDAENLWYNISWKIIFIQKEGTLL
jgi:hypothetical protein